MATLEMWGDEHVTDGGVFHDGLGERRRIVDRTTGKTRDVLLLRDELTELPGFEKALRDRIDRLADFRHAAFASLHGIVGPFGDGTAVGLAFDSVDGERLSDLLLIEGRRAGGPLDFNASLALVRQLVEAVTALHAVGPDISHGALSPERLILGPGARLVVADYALGSALSTLRYSHQKYWQELRVALPRAAGLGRLDQRADLMQIGVVALSLLLGRPLADDECPSNWADFSASPIVASATPLSPGLRAWLTRALHLDRTAAFSSVAEMAAELDQVMSPTPVVIASNDTRVAAPRRAMPTPPPARATRAALAPARVAAPTPTPDQWRPDPAARRQPPVTSAAGGAVGSPRADLPSARAVLTVTRVRRVWQWAAAAVVLLALAGGGILAARRRAPDVAVATGTLILDSNPTGAQILIDGEAHGATPATMTLRAGAHVIELRGPNAASRSISVAVPAGTQVSQYIEIGRNRPTTGRLSVRTNPTGARVSVDGVAKGTAPVTLDEVTPGEHTVVVSTRDGDSVKQTVTVEADTTASLVVPLTVGGSAPLFGFVAVAAPIELQLFENGQLLGSSQSERVMVAAGSHQLDIVNKALGFRVTRIVQVTPNKVVAIPIKLPTGSMAVNAVPWANVFLDGVDLGETPIGNLQTTIGSHELVFRHPDLGEQRRTVTVTLTAPLRVSVDLRRK
jgi:PEGA domain-containing protein